MTNVKMETNLKLIKVILKNFRMIELPVQNESKLLGFLLQL